MANVKFEGEYDAERNIVYIKFINKPASLEDADFLVEESKRLWEKGGENKVWSITDLSKMGMAPHKIISYYKDKADEVADKYVVDFCIVCEKTMERMAAQLYNILTREQHPIFKTKDEAIDWVLKEQETKGRFVPL